jgi:hypothetical protein
LTEHQAQLLVEFITTNSSLLKVMEMAEFGKLMWVKSKIQAQLLVESTMIVLLSLKLVEPSMLILTLLIDNILAWTTISILVKFKTLAQLIFEQNIVRRHCTNRPRIYQLPTLVQQKVTLAVSHWEAETIVIILMQPIWQIIIWIAKL